MPCGREQPEASLPSDCKQGLYPISHHAMPQPPMNSNQRLSDKSGGAWAKIRARILRRDCGLCQPCKRQGRLTLAVQVDHIVPVSKGGGDEDVNLQSICLACHDDKTRADLGLKSSGACDARGMPQSAGHHWNRATMS